MPALPWLQVSVADPGAELTVMASRLPLRRYRHIPGFLRWTMRIRAQLSNAPGLVGYSLDAHLLGKTFWTLSAWTGRQPLEEFVRTEPHKAAMAAIPRRWRSPASFSGRHSRQISLLVGTRRVAASTRRTDDRRPPRENTSIQERHDCCPRRPSRGGRPRPGRSRGLLAAANREPTLSTHAI
jgi:hypothetical protein